MVELNQSGISMKNKPKKTKAIKKESNGLSKLKKSKVSDLYIIKTI